MQVCVARREFKEEVLEKQLSIAQLSGNSDMLC